MAHTEIGRILGHPIPVLETMDLREQLQSTLGPTYALKQELGGDMSRVFVATDVTLGRRIVVKTMSPDLIGSLSVDRFKREIRLAASLQQANIVPLRSAGDVGGLPVLHDAVRRGRESARPYGTRSAWPAITVPMGFTAEGLPAGLELLGRPFSEAQLLGFSYAYEKVTRHRRPPPLTPALW